MTSPATRLSPSGWLTTVKNTPTVFVPLNWKTFPICGLSPQFSCTMRKILLIAAGWVEAPSTVPYMIMPPCGESRCVIGVGGGVDCARAVCVCAVGACVRALQAQRTTMNIERTAVNRLNGCVVTRTLPFREQIRSHHSLRQAKAKWVTNRIDSTKLFTDGSPYPASNWEHPRSRSGWDRP